MSGTLFPAAGSSNTALDEVVEIGHTETYFHILDSDNINTSDEEQLLDGGYIQISSMSSALVPSAWYPDYDNSNIVGWYLKIGHEWTKVLNCITLEWGDNIYWAVKLERGLFTDINDLENYDAFH